MTLKELTADMRRHTGGQGFITATQLADYLGYNEGYQCRKKYCDGLEAINGTRYFIPDVAQRIYDLRKVK